MGEGDVLVTAFCGCVVTDSGRKHIAISPCTEHREVSAVMDALSHLVSVLNGDRTMSKTAEAQIEVEERRKEMAAVVRAYCQVRGLRSDMVDDIDLLRAGGVDACFIVAMLGPKLDAIQSELVDLQNQLDGIRKV